MSARTARLAAGAAAVVLVAVVVVVSLGGSGSNVTTTGSAAQGEPDRASPMKHPMTKAAIVLLADTETHADVGRAANALTTVQEFAEHGDDVALIFDGAGTRWAAELLREESQLHGSFEKVRDKVAGACHYCAGAFDVREELERSDFPLLRDHKGHPSLRRLVADGSEVITF